MAGATRLPRFASAFTCIKCLLACLWGLGWYGMAIGEQTKPLSNYRKGDPRFLFPHLPTLYMDDSRSSILHWKVTVRAGYD